MKDMDLEEGNTVLGQKTAMDLYARIATSRSPLTIVLRKSTGFTERKTQ